MFTHLRLLLLLAASASLVACHLYVDGDEDSDYGEACRGENCSSSQGSWPDAGGPLPDASVWDDPSEPTQSCTASSQCGPGCYCNPAGLCERVPPTPPPAPDAAPFEACTDLSAHESLCISHLDCSPVYRGIGCTAEDGSECTGASVDCSCDSFQYDYCEDAQP